MSEFYFTFEPHPAGGHPDGWFTIEAADSEAARAKMFETCGPKWAMQYDNPPALSVFPRGELKRIST